jgi:hypothetical protein
VPDISGLDENSMIRKVYSVGERRTAELQILPLLPPIKLYCFVSYVFLCAFHHKLTTDVVSEPDDQAGALPSSSAVVSVRSELRISIYRYGA